MGKIDIYEYGMYVRLDKPPVGDVFVFDPFIGDTITQLPQDSTSLPRTRTGVTVFSSVPSMKSHEIVWGDVLSGEKDAPTIAAPGEYELAHVLITAQLSPRTDGGDNLVYAMDALDEGVTMGYLGKLAEWDDAYIPSADILFWSSVSEDVLKAAFRALKPRVLVPLGDNTPGSIAEGREIAERVARRYHTEVTDRGFYVSQRKLNGLDKGHILIFDR